MLKQVKIRFSHHGKPVFRVAADRMLRRGNFGGYQRLFRHNPKLLMPNRDNQVPGNG
jgi:hypothetical protein